MHEEEHSIGRMQYFDYYKCCIFVLTSLADDGLARMMKQSPKIADLSLRELEIARAYADGANYRDIAEQLFIAPTTVRTHLSTVYRKLGVSSKVALYQKLQLAPYRASVSIGHKDLSGDLTSTYSASTGVPAPDLKLPPRPVIAVLPFVNMSGDPDQEFFADGLTEDLITRLSYLRGIVVISGTSSFVFKGQTKQATEISKLLGAKFLLEGSVRRSDDRMRVVAQLIDGETGAHLWGKRYDRRVIDIFGLQDEITHAIVVALQITLTDGEMTLDPGGTEDYTAWESFQQGALAHLKYTAEDNLRARRLYIEAFERDPGFIDARVFHAWTYWQHARSGFAKDREEELAECRGTVDALISEGVTTANFRHLESVTLLLERKYDSALSISTQAVSLGPSKLFGYTPAAVVNIYSGQYQAAADILRESIRTIPSTPYDSIFNLAWVLGLMGDYTRAVPLAEEYMRRVPDDLYSYLSLAIIYGLAGSPELASKTIMSFRERYPNYRIPDFKAHEPFRDPAVLDKVVAVLRAAGLPG
jgi:adenylate cyclase